jgi:hypothetical protein
MKKLIKNVTWVGSAKCSRYASFAWSLTPHLFAAFTVLMILSLPIFPSQDGPVHLYYVDVLRNLLAHTGPYAQYFEIKSYINPYMFEYYTLLGLEQVFSPIMSEKLLICAYVLRFILSFRYLLGSVTEHPTPWALGGALFCLNFYVQMSFLNYAFGTALVLLLAGCWLRWMNHLTAWRIVALSGGFTLLVFTHPLPPAVFLCFAALNLIVSFVLERNREPRSSRKETLRNLWRPLVAVVLMGAVAGAWILHFSDSRPVPPTAKVQKTLGLFSRVLLELSFARIMPIHLGVLQLVLICPTFLIMVWLIAAYLKKRNSLGATLSLSSSSRWCSFS